VCGYIRRVTDNAYVRALLIAVGLDDLVADFSASSGGLEHFYPAFGGDPNKTIKKLIVMEAGKPRVVDATWWFDCTASGAELQVGERTTFNARNLDSNYWRAALKSARGLVVATGLGESQMVAGKKHQYLMEGQGQAFFLGALYRKFDNGKYCCAVITRPATERFAQFHEKAMPLFIPNNAAVVSAWLNSQLPVTPEIQLLLDEPKVSVSLAVSKVKAFKSGITHSTPELIDAD
jgi:putative SOS response-associated peptidase YedK